MRAILLFAASALALGACSASQNPGATPAGSGEMVTESTVSQPSPPAGGDKETKATPLQINLPQLAYVYKLGFRLPGDKVGAAQEAHRALCEKMGPAHCQLVALTNSTGVDAQGVATLKLRVAGADARSFSVAIAKAIADAGGRAIDTNVSVEDVSKDVVDAQARIAQRELLVSRLTEILRARTGKVGELVEAERSVADAQEELDKAKAWLSELRGRVAMSDFEIDYSATAANASPGSTGNQLIEAVSGSGAGFLIGIRILLTLLIYLLPWAILAIPVVLVTRALRRRQAAADSHLTPEETSPDEA